MPLDAKPKVAFICPYVFDTAPGQRFRVELFQPYLGDYLDYKNFYFLDQKTNQVLYKKGFFFLKAFGVLKGFVKRTLSIFSLIRYNYIFIFRESSPIGPPFIEFILAKVFRKKLIYDFDDAIWMTNTSSSNSIVGKLKWHHKVGSICKWSDKISCGNNYLKAYAQEYNQNAFRIPTIVDTEKMHTLPSDKIKNRVPIIGWTGSHSSLVLLDTILPVLKSLREKFEFEFVVIADKAPDLDLKGYRFVPWNRETEIKDLAQVDIGIMPLEDNEWCKGKCGFKAIQYMALGTPAVVSNLGVNPIIVRHGEDGYVCDDAKDWEMHLTALLEDADLRKKMGVKARQRIVSEYSLKSVLPDFLKLFDINV